jgi:hypothetical protein
MELKVTEYNGLTKEIIERPFNADEIAEYEETKAKFAAIKAEAELKAQAKAALLERLGLTQEEFNTLTA